MTGARQPLGIGDVRRHHLSVVLGELVDRGPRSRAALAQRTGLTKATVSALVADLLDRGLVEELATPPAGRVGRPAIDVAASAGHVAGLGLAVDVDHVAAGVVDLTGRVRVLHRRPSDNRAARLGTVLDRLRRVAARALGDAEAEGMACVGGALSLPGLVDPAGTLLVAPNLGWTAIAGDDLVARLGLPAGIAVTLDNEANLAARAELRFGAGRDLSSFVHVSAGVGIGAGVVLDGRLVRGAHGFAGELGHVVVDRTGRPCACGSRGCLETIAGSAADASSDAVAAALAAALRSVVQIIDPQAILLGGSLAGRGDDFAAAVGDRLQGAALSARWPCDVRPARLGPDAALIGAASVALDAVVADPTLVPRRSPADRTA